MIWWVGHLLHCHPTQCHAFHCNLSLSFLHKKTCAVKTSIFQNRTPSSILCIFISISCNKRFSSEFRFSNIARPYVENELVILSKRTQLHFHFRLQALVQLSHCFGYLKHQSAHSCSQRACLPNPILRDYSSNPYGV